MNGFYTNEARVFRFPSGFWGVERLFINEFDETWRLHSLSHRTREEATQEIKRNGWRDVSCTNVLTVVQDQ